MEPLRLFYRHGLRNGPGRAVQVDPIKPTLKALGTKRLKLKYGELLSNVAFKFNLRRYNLAFSFLSASFVRIVRLFRVSRMFRLIKSLKGLKSLFETLLVSLPAFWNVGRALHSSTSQLNLSRHTKYALHTP